MNIVDVLALSVKGYKVDEINELKDIIKKYPDAEGSIMELAKKVSFTDLQSYMKIAEDSSGAAATDSKEGDDNKDPKEPDQETAPKKSEQPVPDIDYKKIEKINSESGGSLGDYTFVANVVNEYKNMIGKPMVVVIQSQLGDPICSYSGNSIYWEVCEDLPKTTKLIIDGKLLYIHRANFQLVDKALLN